MVFECDFEEPPEKVWRALTEPGLLDVWLTAGESSSAAPDSTVRRTGSSDYEVVTAEPHRLVRYHWRDRDKGAHDSSGREVHSVVTVELAPGPEGGTHLRLTHGDFRIVSAAPSMTAVRVRPITSARRARARRTATVMSLATQYSLPRAA
jgi:uncharacterized protein YndB with AHSA1/START domain